MQYYLVLAVFGVWMFTTKHCFRYLHGSRDINCFGKLVLAKLNINNTCFFPLLWNLEDWKVARQYWILLLTLNFCYRFWNEWHFSTWAVTNTDVYTVSVKSSLCSPCWCQWTWVTLWCHFVVLISVIVPWMWKPNPAFVYTDWILCIRGCYHTVSQFNFYSNFGN